jgi:c-di-GMP-binding flagellar brake protein YcgR
MTDMADPLQAASSMHDENERITLPAQIAGVLRRLQEAHVLLRITIPGENQAFLSALLEVHPVDGYLLLDELTPAEGNVALLRARRIGVSAQLQGVDISFTTDLMDTGSSAQIAYYRMTMPQAVRYQQRRTSYRARINLARVIPVLLTREDGVVVEGQLYDISVGGIGSRHPVGKAHDIQQGATWEECRIRLDGDHEIRSALEVRFIGEDARSRQMRVGGKFLNLARPQIKIIENFVAALERDWLKKLRRERGE